MNNLYRTPYIFLVCVFQWQTDFGLQMIWDENSSDTKQLREGYNDDDEEDEEGTPTAICAEENSDNYD